MEISTDYPLTKFSHGAGCGCKLSPEVLETIVQRFDAVKHFPSLLVGNEGKDDAAVYQINDEQAIISTTDFFMPIVDDAFDFGRIASANAISDVYAMGGKPLMAIAILGWPIDKIPAEYAAKVLEGSRAICAEASIPLAGGHSIDCPEPVFGLAVTGIVHPSRIKRNAGAEEGNLLYLTKPIGVGILSTAQKKGLSNPAAAKAALDTMTRLNLFGEKLGNRTEVKALTDVTGFGLLGHLGEICDAANLTADLHFSAVPLIPEAKELLEKGCIPGGTKRNLASYEKGIFGGTEEQKLWLADPQTSGGLLIAVDAGQKEAFEDFALQYGHDLSPIGQLKSRENYRINIL